MTAREDRLRDAILEAFMGQGEAWTTDESGDTLAAVAAQAAERVLPPEPEQPVEPETPEDAVAAARAAGKALSSALAGYEPEDWRDAVRLLHALRAAVEVLRVSDASLVRWLYLHGEHGQHQLLDGVGAFSITRGRSKERWQVAPAAQDYVEAQIIARDGEVPDPRQVVEWVLEVLPSGESVSVKKTPLRKAGLDVDDYYTSEPGSLQVGLPRPEVT